MADISYSKINWENEPSHNTPLSAQNLNKMDTAIDELVTKSNSLVPNPVSAPTEGLEKLEYDGTVYEVKGGHKILNDSGSVLTQMDNMQFNGVYTHNASTITEVDIVREFQSKAEIEALTGEAKKGFEVIGDTEEYIPYTGSDILFDNTDTSFEGENVQEVLEEVDTALDNIENGILLLTIPANTYNTWTLALQALYVEYNKLTTEQKKRCSIIRNDDIVYKCSAISSAFTSVYAGSTTLTVIQSLFLQSGIYLNHSIEGATISSTSLSNTTQHQKIELRLN